jgi:Ca2+-transporting ATPase
VWELGLFSNLRLFVVVALSLGLQIAIHYLAPLRAVFETTPVPLAVGLSWLALAAVPSTVLEIEKLVRRRWRASV